MDNSDGHSRVRSVRPFRARQTSSFANVVSEALGVKLGHRRVSLENCRQRPALPSSLLTLSRNYSERSSSTGVIRKTTFQLTRRYHATAPRVINSQNQSKPKTTRANRANEFKRSASIGGIQRYSFESVSMFEDLRLTPHLPAG